MRLYLARHGEAVSKQEHEGRPLSAQGREDVARVAGFLGLFERPRPARILHSGKMRAEQTAAMFAEAWRLPAPHREEGLTPGDDPALWEARLREWTGGDLMLVGHLPHLERLAARLLCPVESAPFLTLETAGVACLEGGGGDWRLIWLMMPRLLRG